MRRIRFVVPILLLAAAPALAVEVRCVDTVEKLDAAVRVATDDDVEIHLVQGTYDIDHTVLTDFGLTDPEPDDDITVIGGYTSGCGSRALEPFSTILTSSGGRWIDIEGHDDSGNVTFESVEFKDLPSLIILGGPFSGGYTARYSRVAFVRSPLLTITAHTQISQSLFVAAPNLPQMRDCALYVADPDSVSIVHSVFTGNHTKGFCIDDNTPSGGWHVDAYNNIFWGNAGTDIYLRSSDSQTDAVLASNIIESASIVPAPATAPSGSLNQDPKFVDPASDNYRLQIGSPAINSGSTASLGISEDIDGGLRQIGSAPDRGAYESNVDDTQIITVTNTSDQLTPPLLAGSLRWAIDKANHDAGLNYIHFNIPGGCPHIIDLNGPLPDITDRVIIDGYTQAGSAPNTSGVGFNATICIGIRGDLSDNYAFRIPAGVGAAYYLQLSGVAVGGFDVAAIDLQGGGDSWIHGVQFAGQLGATAIGNSAVNVRIGGASYYNLIGGDDNADRNVIPFAYSAGVQLLATGADSHQNYVTNNLIGTTRGGTGAAPNQTGVYVTSRNNQIRDNVISGNTKYGIELSGVSAHDNFIAGNRIGLTVPPTLACFPPPCGNNEDLANGSSGIIGHNDASDNTINNNRIAYNGGSGIRLISGQHNSLLTNITYANGGMGIDLGAGGPEPVDNDGDPSQAVEPNRGINYPALTLAQGGMQHGTVSSLLVSTNGSYVVQLYSDSTCDTQGHGEGRVYHGGVGVTIANATAGNNGSALFEIPITSSTTLVGRVFSLTARDSLGNSSEYSQCALYQCDQIFANAFDNGLALTCPAP